MHPSVKLYREYFAVLEKLTSTLEACVIALSSSTGVNRNITIRALQGTIARLSYSVKALQYKYAYSHGAAMGLTLQVASSGFPSSSEISGMMTQLVLRDERLRRLSTLDVLIDRWIDRAFEERVDDQHLLEIIGERRYLECLDPNKILCDIIFGDFEERGLTSDGKRRKYAFWWTNYDTYNHAPSILIMEFEQEIRDDLLPVHLESDDHELFIETLVRYGKSMSELSGSIVNIDLTLPDIFPKRVTRIQLDKLYTRPFFSLEKQLSEDDKLAQELLHSYGSIDDFILVVTHDVLRSKGEKVHKSKGGWLSSGREQILQIFDLDETSKLAYMRGSTESRIYTVIPHDVAVQCEDQQNSQPFLPFSMADTKLVYTNEGDVNAIA